MKRFTNKQECLDWLIGNYKDSEDALYFGAIDWVCLDMKNELTINDVNTAFKNKHTDLDSKQQLEQRVVESFGIDESNETSERAKKVARTLSSIIENLDENTGQNKYTRNLKGVECDVYDVLKAFDVTCPALQHLIKKALCAGLRGHKDKTQDLKDILDSAKRAIELNDSEVE